MDAEADRGLWRAKNDSKGEDDEFKIEKGVREKGENTPPRSHGSADGAQTLDGRGFLLVRAKKKITCSDDFAVYLDCLGVYH